MVRHGSGCGWLKTRGLQHDGIKTPQQAAQPEPVQSPVAATGDEWQHDPTGEHLPVAVEEGQHRAAGIVRPGRAGEDDQVRRLPTDLAQRFDRHAKTEKRGEHHQEGSGHGTDGETERNERLQPLQRHLHAFFAETGHQPVQQSAGLPAVRKIDHQHPRLAAACLGHRRLSSYRRAGARVRRCCHHFFRSDPGRDRVQWCHHSTPCLELPGLSRRR